MLGGREDNYQSGSIVPNKESNSLSPVIPLAGLLKNFCVPLQISANQNEA